MRMIANMKCNILYDFCTYGSISIWISHCWKQIGKAISEWNLYYLYNHNIGSCTGNFQTKEDLFIYFHFINRFQKKRETTFFMNHYESQINKLVSRLPKIDSSCDQNVNSHVWRYYLLLINLETGEVDRSYKSAFHW